MWFFGELWCEGCVCVGEVCVLFGVDCVVGGIGCEFGCDFVECLGGGEVGEVEVDGVGDCGIEVVCFFYDCVMMDWYVLDVGEDGEVDVVLCFVVDCVDVVDCCFGFVECLDVCEEVECCFF